MKNYGSIKLSLHSVSIMEKINAHLIASRNPEDYMNFINDKISSISEEDKTDVLWKPVKERNSQRNQKNPQD